MKFLALLPSELETSFGALHCARGAETETSVDGLAAPFETIKIITIYESLNVLPLAPWLAGTSAT